MTVTKLDFMGRMLNDLGAAMTGALVLIGDNHASGD